MWLPTFYRPPTHSESQSSEGRKRSSWTVDCCISGPLCGAAAQFGQTPLIRAADNGHIESMRMLLDRGADMEAKGRVRSAAVHCCATGRAGRARGGDGDDASGRRARVVGRRGRRRWSGGGMSVGERWRAKARLHAGLWRRRVVPRRLFGLHPVAIRTRWSCCWTGAPTWRPRKM